MKAKRRTRTKTEAEIKRVSNLSRQNFKKQHDQLERSVQQLAWLVYRIRLYKTDAGAVAAKCECGRTNVRRARIKRGLPDLIGCAYGRFLGVEIKTGVGVLRESQEGVTGELIEAGAHVFVIHSMAEAQAAFAAVVKEGTSPQAKGAE